MMKNNYQHLGFEVLFYLYRRFYVNCKIFRRQHQNGKDPKCVAASDYKY